MRQRVSEQTVMRVRRTAASVVAKAAAVKVDTPARANVTSFKRPEPTDFDVVIVGAGLSGIGVAYHLQRHCPNKSFVILEARDAIGGTWDLFRYPGIRSDSDMHTLGYRFRPWRGEKAIADGASILSYLHETAGEYGIDRKIRFNHKVIGTGSLDARGFRPRWPGAHHHLQFLADVQWLL
jgi:ribulose 1,5-bisphosphate synthetase/thiazole synthase